MTIKCFEPLDNTTARILILGSMPGIASLEAKQYYAHPRNAFWPIMQNITGVDATAAYAERLEGLKKQGIDLWDVIANCQRQGSLDSAIEIDSLQINDFKTYLQNNKNLRLIALNGGKAYALFKKHVLPTINEHHDIKIIQLPSTSPAYASMSFDEKKKRWLEQLRLP